MNGIALVSAALAFLVLTACSQGIRATTAGEPMVGELVIVSDGTSDSTILVSPEAGQWEKRAAVDLAHYIKLMSGASVSIADTEEAVAAAMDTARPLLVIGREALKADPGLADALKRVARQDPVLRADAIVVRRDGNRVYMAGLTDDGHYHAVSYLLHQWGCRWYLPTEIGQCIPEHPTLKVGGLDHAYASPFELRSYWLSWNGNVEGKDAFQLRNFMTRGVHGPGAGHALGSYTRDIAPEGDIFKVPLAAQDTIKHVAAQMEDVFKNSGTASLAMEDGVYTSDSPIDNELKAGLFDKYFLTPSMSDVFMTFYNGVCELGLAKYPDSKARIGFLGYSNMTLPPQRVRRAAKPLVCALAPIDIDPIHGMDDAKSPPRQEYRQMLYDWAKVMEGRVWIYDYDQSMLVWRDTPNPSHQAFRQDVQHYRKAGIIGVNTESRGAIATTWFNLHLRGQLMWDPDLDVDAHLAELYERFYGPAAEPMTRYWDSLFAAWEDSVCTEHEFFVAPAIYTPELVERLRRELETAELIIRSITIRETPTRNEKLYLERMKLTRLSFDLIDQYMAMVRAAAGECDYETAHEIGKRAIQTRLQIARINPTFTTRVVGVAAEPEYGGSPAWWPGEVKQYGDLAKCTDGTEGALVAKLPMDWAFRRDPNDTGLARGFAHRPADLTYWAKNKRKYQSPESRKDYPTTEWEVVRTDLYPQAQGVLHPNWESFTGFMWYKANAELDEVDALKQVHIRCPGLFGEAWLYANGVLVAHRDRHPVWWRNDYSFEWDVDLTGKLKPGQNDITVRVKNEHHMGGMFRRPFLYRPVAP